MSNEKGVSEYFQNLAQEGILGTTTLFATNVLATGLAAINSIILARSLGPLGYGQYTLALTSIQMLLLATGLGLSTSITYYVSRQIAQNNSKAMIKTLKTTLFITGINSIVVFLVGLLIVPIIMRDVLEAEEVTKAAMIALPIIIIVPILNVITSFFIGVKRTNYTGITNASREALRLLMLSILILTVTISVNNATLIYTATYIVSITIAALLMLRVLKSLPKDVEISEEAPNIKELLIYGFPFYVAGILGGFLNIYQNTLMARVASATELAGLRASMNVITALNLISSPIYAMALPIFSKAIDKSMIPKIYRLAQGLASALITPLTMYFLIESSALLRLFYGEKYVIYDEFLVILSLTNFTVLLGAGLMGGALAGAGKSWKANSITLIELASFLLASYPLSRSLDALGIVISITLSRWIATIYGLIMSEKAINISIDKWINLKVMLASCVSLVATKITHQLLPQDLPAIIILLITGTTLLLTYITVVSALKPFREHELDFLLLSIEGKGLVYKVIKLVVKVYKKTPKLQVDKRDKNAHRSIR